MDISDDTELPKDAHGWAPGGPFWGGLDHLLRNKAALSPHVLIHDASATETFLREQCHILIIGAGGLGCELLKNIALSGVRHIDIIDLDTIDVTNLNRQFLFRADDVGKSKAIVAAKYVNARVPSANIVPHHANITSFSREFYAQFHVVVSGLDSIEARRWLNAMLINVVDVRADGEYDENSMVPLIDGGTEGFRGQARLIFPRLSSCFECTLNLFPPTDTFPLCTIANTPRLPEHCIEYANVVLWNKLKPFGDVKLDMDSPEHTAWLFEKAQSRAEQFGINGVTYRLTQGVVKNIIPAVASTNAIIAAACTNELLKMVSSIAPNFDNYMMYNGTFGVYTYTYKNEKRPDCPVCGAPVPRKLVVKRKATLADFLAQIEADTDIRSRNPFIRSDQGSTLYASAPAPLQKATKRNLSKRLDQLITSGAQLSLSEKDLPFIRTLIINFED